MKYNETSDSWNEVGTTQAAAGPNHQYTSLYVKGGILYLAYKDGWNSNKATVEKYDDTSTSASTGWETVGDAGFSAGSALFTSLFVDNGTPYLAYRDGGYSNTATVKKYNETNASWETVGNAGFSAGLANYISLYVEGGTPYVAYSDNIQAKATVMKLARPTVTFVSNGGTAVASQTVSYGSTASEPTPAPTKPGHTFGGWYANSGLTTAFNFATAITGDTTLYAKWTPNSYTVSFNVDGGSAVANQTVSYLGMASEPTPAPTKPGHTFGGWYADEELTTAFDFAAPITGDTPVYAKWTANSYTVSFNVDGGTAVADQTVSYGGTAGEPMPAPTKPGHTFGGWYANEELTTSFDFAAPITGDTPVYAKWTPNSYTVSFNVDGGTAVADQTVSYGGTAGEPMPAPTKPGHTFGGWYANEELTTSFDFATPITGDTPVYAKWTPNSYTVSFNVDGGTAVANQTVSYGGTATEPTAPTKPGHTFGGWYANEELTTSFDFAAPITGDTPVYAKWTANSYTVSFNVDGGTAVANQTVSYGGTATEPTAPTKPGHTFGGWYVNEELTTSFDFAAPITGDTPVYAKWTPNSYTVSFNVDGGTAVANQTVSYLGTASEPTPDPTKPGHTFGGWYVNEELTTSFDFAAPITDDTPVYAKWTPNSYTVSFNVDGGTAVANQTVSYLGMASEPTPDPTKPGHTFGGWYANEELTTSFDFATPITGDTPVYAKWTPNNYTVSFNVDGGTAVASQTVSYLGMASEPTPDPTKPGHTFGGWYVNEELTTSFDFAAPITDDTPVYAKWTPNSYTVSFNVDGGTAVANQTVSYLGMASEPTPDPTKPGHTFGGWYANEELTTSFDFATPITGDTPVYAKWTPNNYTVSFNVDGGSAVASQTVSYLGMASEPTPDPTKPGHTFGGWYANEELTTSFDFAAPITDDTPVYAKWTPNSYTVSFNVDGGTAVANQTVSYGGTASEPTPDPTKPGHTFGGWYADEELTTSFDFAAPITGDTPVYAKWTSNSYTVSFNVDGGTAVADQTVSYGGTAGEPMPAPTKPGHTFGGWYADSDLTAAYTFDTAITGDVMLYAKWTTSTVTATTYTVTYSGNRATSGSVPVDNDKYEEGDTVTVLDNTGSLMRTGYIFSGWNTAADDSDHRYSAGATFLMGTADVTLYAKWEVKKNGSTPTDSASASKYEIIPANVESVGGLVVAIVNIIRMTDASGRKTDQIALPVELASKAVQQLTAEGSDLARIVIPDPNDEVAELTFSISAKSARLLAGGGIGMEIDTDNVLIRIPSTSLQGTADDLFFRVVPIKAEDERKEIEQRAKTDEFVLEEAVSGGIEVIGRPMTIETNMPSLPVTLVLPLSNASLNEGQASEWSVFIEHSDGTKELVAGDIVAYDATGMSGIEFTTSKFSTFTVIQMKSESTDEEHGAYIFGFPNGTFGPERTMTRAEMATILARLFVVNGRQASVTFTDIASGYWAKDAIDKVTATGMMSGYPDGRFKPEAPITRAEMAAILVRLPVTNVRGSVEDFVDIDGHWAEAAIKRAAASGIVNGYVDGTFRPDRTLTRAEAVTILNRLLGRGPLYGTVPKWTDVPESYWAYGQIQEASIVHSYVERPTGEEE
ncbi:InlB B-repeat-containing protein [Cohnella fermenti]|nr:InlB B-repeat-containing protein [Cohnella fermenti]